MMINDNHGYDDDDNDDNGENDDNGDDGDDEDHCSDGWTWPWL